MLENLLDEYPNIRLCLDFGRIHIQECIDDNFVGCDIIKKIGRYTYLVHLWNGKVEGNGHYPALKSLSVEDGWGDMELEECYQWIGELVKL